MNWYNISYFKLHITVYKFINMLTYLLSFINLSKYHSNKCFKKCKIIFGHNNLINKKYIILLIL